MGTTTDPTDPRLGRGVDETPIDQHDVYLVLSNEELARGFVRPYREGYIHDVCGTVTWMGRAIAETYARNPGFYGATYCCQCRKHLPVGAEGEFRWVEANGTLTDERVGT